MSMHVYKATITTEFGTSSRLLYALSAGEIESLIAGNFKEIIRYLIEQLEEPRSCSPHIILKPFRDDNTYSLNLEVTDLIYEIKCTCLGSR